MQSITLILILHMSLTKRFGASIEALQECLNTLQVSQAHDFQLYLTITMIRSIDNFSWKLWTTGNEASDLTQK